MRARVRVCVCVCRGRDEVVGGRYEVAFEVMMVTGVLLEEDHVGWWTVTKQINTIVSCVSLPTRAYMYYSIIHA